MVTHDLDSLHTVCDRIAVLADGKVIAAGTNGDDARLRASMAEVAISAASESRASVPLSKSTTEMQAEIARPDEWRRPMMETRANYS